MRARNGRARDCIASLMRERSYMLPLRFSTLLMHQLQSEKVVGGEATAC